MRTSILTSCHLLVVAMLFLYLISPAETLLQLQHATHARVPLSHPTTTMRPRRLRRLNLQCTAGGFAKPKGFSSGEPPPSSSKIKATDKCPCCSSALYGDCCSKFHSFLSVPSDVTSLVRARYCAFATGNADFLIDTTYHTQKDYKRHAESSLDPKKARKAWGKEIKNKNTDIFEFLKLEMLDIKEADPSAISKAKEIGDAQTAVFRIIVRLKSDKSFVYFKETSIFRLWDEKNSESLQSLSQTKQNILYAEGFVSPLTKEQAEEFAKGVGYLTDVSIKDRW